MSGINPEKAERIRSLLTPRVFIAVFLWAVTCAALCFVEFRMYDGAVKTAFIYALIIPPVHILGWLSSGERKKKEVSERRKKIWFAVWIIVLTGLAATMFLLLIRSPSLWLTGLQSLAVIIANLPFTVLERRRGESAKFTASSAACTFAAILLATGLYLLIASPATVADAERTLRDEGYQITKYVGYMPPNVNKMYGNIFPGDWNVEMGAFSFNVERGDVGYRIYVDVKNGAVRDAMSFDEHPYLTK